jgi:hypothetical protein
MRVQHVGPGLEPRADETKPDRPAERLPEPDLMDRADQPASQPRPSAFDDDILDPGVAEEAFVDPDAYAHELDPLGTKRKSKVLMAFLFLVVLGGLAGLVWVFKDQLTRPVEVPETGRVKVTSVPGGADVYLDDQHQVAQTPMELANIKPGEEHELRVELPDQPPWKTRFTLTDTTKPLEINAVLNKDAADQARMAGKPIIAGLDGEGSGSISVTSTPAGALIYLDGVSTGKKTPSVLKAVPAGLDHAVLVELEGKAPAYDRLSLAAGQEAKLEFPLEDQAEPLDGRLVVRFESEPEGAKVTVNGYPMSKPTPMAAKLLIGSPSEIELEHPGRKKKTVLQVRPVPRLDLTVFVKLK